MTLSFWLSVVCLFVACFAFGWSIGGALHAAQWRVWMSVAGLFALGALWFAQ